MNLRVFSVAVAAVAVAAVPLAAHAQWWSQHPAYLHAMSDLRQAYWLESHHSANDPAQNADEGNALTEIHTAYKALKDAAVTDDKDIDDQPPANFDFSDHRGRLHRALGLLHDAHNQLTKAEDNPDARGLRNTALQHVDAAGRDTRAAIKEWHF